MNPNPDSRTERLDDLMDRYLFGLLDAEAAGRARRKIEDDPEWQLAYEAAVARRRALAEGVKAGAAEGAQRAPDAAEIVAAAEKRRGRQRKRRRIFFGGTTAAAAAAGIVIALSWLPVVRLAPPVRSVRLVGQTSLLGGAPAAFRAIVTDAAGSRRLAGVPVRLVLPDPTSRTSAPCVLAEWTTDADGVAAGQVAVPDWPDGAYQLRAVAGDEAPASVSVPIRIRRARRIYLATDKPIYQPGQTVHMRCLVLRKPHLKPDAGEKVTFTVRDERDNLVFSQSEKLSEFGIASADLPTDPLITPGRYRIAVAAGGDASEQTVEIHHYKLPAFAVRIELDQPWYLPGHTITGTVEVRYHFGKPAAGAKVELRLCDRVLGPEEVLGETAAAADRKGRATFRLPLPPTLFGSRRTGGDMNLLLSARAVDTAGQEHTAHRTVVVASQAIRIAAVAENGAAADGLDSRLFVVTSYPDGRPAATTVSVEGLGQSARTDPAGAVVFSARRFPDPLRIFARDGRGRTGQATLSVPRGDGSLVLRTDKPIYRAGETVRVEALADGAAEVFLDVVKDRQTRLTRSLRMDEAGRATLALDLPAELVGTLRLHAYRVDRQGEWVGRDALIVVRPATQLRVAVEKDKDTYRPGEDAKITFTVTDEQGRTTPAALSLAAVDEAVYSVQQAHPGLAATLLGLDEELLRPAVEVHGFAPARATDSDPYAAAMLAAALSPPDSTAGADMGAAAKVHTLNQSSRRRDWSSYYDGRNDARNRAQGITAATAVGGAVVLLALLIMVAWDQLREAGRRFRQSAAFVPVIVVVALLPALALALLLLLSLGVAGFEERMLGARARVPFGVASMAPPDSVVPPRKGSPTPEPARVRTYFPETLLWRPQVITDASGTAVLNVPMADSITTWRLAGQAVSRAGRLGTVASGVQVFQPFFVDVDAPAALTRGDEVSVPLVVYNYTKNLLRVSLRCEASAGLTILDGGRAGGSMKAGEVRRFHVRLRAESIGEPKLLVRASAGAVADAIERPIRVNPPGLPQSVAVNGEVTRDEQVVELTVPADAVDGSISAWMKVYPSRFSELLDGLENIFRMPSGCFEQTSSTTYPNVLALAYLDTHKLGSPETRAKARRYIHLGYQRLLGFEVDGGGFDWFGRPPANVLLTAYGLMEFADMAKVHAVDPKLLSRTADWLASRQQGDGSWGFRQGCFHEPFTGGDTGDLAITAYVTWAIATFDPQHRAARRGAAYLAEHVGEARSVHTLALCANALLAADGGSDTGRAAARELAGKSLPGRSAATPPAAYRRARAHPGETTTVALIAQALRQAGGHSTQLAEALRWLVERRDPAGTWQTTQATVMALRALIRAAGAPEKRSATAQLEVAAVGDGGEAAEPLGKIRIPPERSEVVHTVRLDGLTRPGTYRLRLRSRQAGGMAWQFVVRYHSEAATAAAPPGTGVTVRVAYDRTSLQANETVAVRATVTNRTARAARMLIVDLGTPPGFVVRPGGLEKLRAAGTIERYTLTARGVIVYLRTLAAGASVRIEYEMAAKMPLRAVAPPARVYAYYDPSQEAASPAVPFAVD